MIAPVWLAFAAGGFIGFGLGTGIAAVMSTAKEGDGE